MEANSPCIEHVGDNTYRCRNHGWVIRTDTLPIHCACGQPHGVGYHLKRLLARILLLGRAGCGCDVHAAEMDRNAPDWCEANIDTIVGWMRAEAKKRKLPFSVRGARLLVRVAIRNARREEARESKALSLTTPPRLEKRENPKSFLWGPPPD
ncbi:hypothetical protein LCGC14_0336500 [marine sediment metagenome]|uniref:Uncharacterized protein n=1 Tax=marine sediment metagenome TaxID=412755 RepID=A0A0F9TF54_9ZZZZ